MREGGWSNGVGVNYIEPRALGIDLTDMHGMAEGRSGSEGHVREGIRDLQSTDPSIDLRDKYSAIRPIKWRLFGKRKGGRKKDEVWEALSVVS